MAAFLYLEKSLDMKWTKAIQFTFIVAEIHTKSMVFWVF